MGKFLFVNIGPGISIVTLGSINLVVATFISGKTQSDVPLFFLSALCLILSGSIVIYFKSVLKRDASDTLDKISKEEKLGFMDRFELGGLSIANIMSNTLFDIGLLFLIFGTIGLLLGEIIVSDFLKESKYIWIICLLALINNILKRRLFV